MLVTLTPGANRDHVLELLRRASLEIVNSSGDPGAYAQWVLEQVRMLRGQIARSDVDKLLLTPSFYRIFESAVPNPLYRRQLLEAEMAEQQTLLTAAYEALQQQISRWSPVMSRGCFAVVDSSVFLSHPDWVRDDDPAKVIASIPWAKDLGLGFEDVLLVLPEVVIRELDRLKESGNQMIRWRASVTLAVIDRLLPDPYATVTVREKDSDWDGAAERDEMPRGAVRLRVFYDDPAHRPLSDPDAEVIDRAVAVQTLAGRPVRLVTMDTGMGLNGRRAGLAVTKPARRVEPPPAKGQSARGRRRAADQVDDAAGR